MRKLILALLLTTSAAAGADCVTGAKLKTKYMIFTDSNTVLLTGGIGSDIMIKTYAFLSSSSKVTVLKDSFCSYGNAVLYIDGKVVDANEVTGL